MESYSTSGAGRHPRLSYWNDLHCRLFEPIEVKPYDRGGFVASLSIERLGPLAFVETFSHAAEIERTDRHVGGGSDRRAFLLLPLEGRIASTQYGHDVEVDEGDFVMTDSLTPSRTAFGTPNRSIGVQIPYAVLSRHMPDADALFGLCLSGRHGLGPLLASTVRSIWTHLRQGMPAQLGDGVAKGLLDFVAAAYAMEHRPRVESSAASARRSQIKRFIERHLRDSDLTAQSVAERLGLSSRYTRLVFAAEGESVSSYILRRRLEECAHQLTNALWNRRSITETAFEWGFSSMSHFTRSFKDRFDVTPTEYRRSRAS